MAVYKVPQDVEAEDKFLGPLSFKQFLFFGGTAVLGYLTFYTMVKGLWPISIVFGLPTIMFAFLAFPWSKEQPTELWLAARIRFLIKARKRIWDQTGMKDLVNITVPKKPVHSLTDGLNQGQVSSRMSALASVIDSRGWATKNYVAVQAVDESDRLVESNVDESGVVSNLDEGLDDVMDEQKGAIAKHFDDMINKSEKQHRSETKSVINKAKQQTSKKAAQNEPKNKSQEDFWFMHQNNQPLNNPNLATFAASPVVAPGSNNTNQTTASSGSPVVNLGQPTKNDEESLLESAHEKHRREKLQTTSRHEKNVHPVDHNATHKKQDKTTVTPQRDPDILRYANDNNLYVDTMQRQAKKDRDLPTDEVVVPLH